MSIKQTPLVLAGFLTFIMINLPWANAVNAPSVAKAVLMPASGSQVHGWVKFSTQGKQLKVWGEVNGLPPGKHGFHVHEYGDCAAPDAVSAGGHFAAMMNQMHGDPQVPGHHSGDMGNIEANAMGIAKIDIKLNIGISIQDILGRGLIVHEKSDDMKTQPSGAAGNRIACGIIGLSNN